MLDETNSLDEPYIAAAPALDRPRAAMPRRASLRPLERFTALTFFIGVAISAAAGHVFEGIFKPIILAIGPRFLLVLPVLLATYLLRLLGVSRLHRGRVQLASLAIFIIAFFATGTGAEGDPAFERIMTFSFANPLVRLNLMLGALAAGALALALIRNPAATRRTLRRQAALTFAFLRPLLCLLFCLVVYSNVKPLALVFRSARFDALFLRFDHAFALGHDPYVLLTSIPLPGFADLMERSYIFFFLLLMCGVMAMLLFGSVRQTERAISAFVVAYILGLVGYFLLPAWGPAFASATAPIFHATDTFMVRQILSASQEAFLADPVNAPVLPFAGIAAWPSLHVAHSVLVLAFLWRVQRPLVYLLAIPFVLLVISTVYLGIHYIADLVAGLGVAWLSYRTAQYLVPDPRRRASQRPTA